MKYIKLTQGKKAMVDDEDYEELSQYRWLAGKNWNTFYASRIIKLENGKYVRLHMHRFIMNTPKGMQTDHIDHNGLNNCKENLRICTCSENAMNQSKPKNNTSGYKGVSWHKKNKKWRSKICIKGKNIYLGYFLIKQDAYKAYCEASKKYHGEYGNTK